MAKQFIKKTKWHITKNRVQEMCQNNLQELDCSLVRNLEDAKKLIINAFNRAINDYNGRAKLPELKSFTDEKTSVYYIEDVIYLSIYKVENDFSH